MIQWTHSNDSVKAQEMILFCLNILYKVKFLWQKINFLFLPNTQLGERGANFFLKVFGTDVFIEGGGRLVNWNEPNLGCTSERYQHFWWISNVQGKSKRYEGTVRENKRHIQYFYLLLK